MGSLNFSSNLDLAARDQVVVELDGVDHRDGREFPAQPAGAVVDGAAEGMAALTHDDSS